MSKIVTLMEWFKEITRYPHDTHKFVQVLEREVIENPSNPDESFERIIVNIYTDTHCYNIIAIDRFNSDGYLGCQVSTRKSRAGEDWFRGNDLPDGPFTRNTWEKIKDAIIGYELVELSISHEYDECNIPENSSHCCAESVPIDESQNPVACNISSKDCKT